MKKITLKKAGRRVLVPACVLAAEILSVVLLIVQLSACSREVIAAPVESLTGTTTYEEEGGGRYVDETFSLPSDGLFTSTKEYALPAGVYQVMVSYSADADGNKSAVTADTPAYGELLEDDTPLPSKLHLVTYHVYLLGKTQNFCVRTYYGGSGHLVVGDIAIARTNILERIRLTLAITAFVLIDLIWLDVRKSGSMKKQLYKRRVPLLILAAALAAMLPLWDGGIDTGFDTGFHLLRIEGLAGGLSSGSIPVKLQTNWLYGYGYPVSLYYPDLFLVLPALLRMIGFSVQFSYDVFLLCLNTACAGTAYYCMRKMGLPGDQAYVSMLFYLLNPYRMLNLYTRGAVGESLAMVFLPLVIYGFWAVLTEPVESPGYKKLWIPVTVGLSGIAQSHLLSCVMCAELILLTCIIRCRKVFTKKRFMVLLKAAVYTVLLNAWFLIPCATSLDGMEITQPYRKYRHIQYHSAKLRYLFGTGTEGATPGIGAAAALVLLLSGHLLILEGGGSTGTGKGPGREKGAVPEEGGEKKSKKESKKAGEENSSIRICSAMRFFFFLSILLLWMSTVYFPWDRLADLLGDGAGIITSIQFATRYLSVAAAFLMFLLGDAFLLLDRKKREEENGEERREDRACRKDEEKSFVYQGAVTAHPETGAAILLVLGLTLAEFLAGVKTADIRKMYDITAYGRTDYNVAEYLYCPVTEYTSDDFLANKEDLDALIPGRVVTGDNVTCDGFLGENLTWRGTFKNGGTTESFAELPLLYYTQYKAFDDAGRALTLEPGDNRVIRLILPAQFDGSVTIKYVYPALWYAAEAVSAVTLIGLVLSRIHARGGRGRRRKKNKQAEGEILS